MDRGRVAELSAEAQRRSALARSPLVERLSVVAGFDPAQFASEGDYPDVERLFCEPLPTQGRRPELILAEGPRIDVLAEMLRRGGIEELARTRRAGGPLPETALQRALDAFTLAEPWPLGERDEDGLVASLEVWRWATEAITLAGLAGSLSVEPGRDLIESRLSILELTRALRRLLVGGFVGRTAELDRLHGFCAARTKGNFVDDPPMLVYGIGGVGKSTLIARFVLDLVAENEPGTPTAWAYLDFDRPTLSSFEPTVLLRDISRQIAAQFPGSRPLLQDHQRTEQYRSVGAGLEAADTAASYRDAALDLARAIQRLKIDRLVVVLDTFEEVERRVQSAADQISGLFATLAAAVPGFRLVISGRAPARAFTRADRPDRHLALAPFDAEPAVELLSHLVLREAELAGMPPPDLDVALAHDVVRLVGGIPLTLRLAARILVHEGPVFNAVVRGRTLDRVRTEFVRGFLYQRVLDHLVGVDPALGDALRQVARASLVLRRVTPELVEKVLLPALQPRPEVSVPDLYRALASEVALADESDGVLRLRAELRGPALTALQYDDPGLVRRVHELAANAYAAAAYQPDARAESAYHRLAQGEPVSALGDLVDDAVLRSLEPSLGDLPEAAARTVKEALRNPSVLAAERDLRDWERRVQPAIDAALRAGRLDEARRLLTERSQRTEFTPLWRLESRLREAEGNLPEAIRAADLDRGAAAAAHDVTRFAAAVVRLAALHEQSGEVQQAVQVLRDGEAGTLLAGHPEVRLELLLNRMNAGERGGLDDQDERWTLELDARSLIQRADPYALAANTALTRLLAAALGEGEPERIREAARTVGLGHEEDPVLVNRLVDAIVAWDTAQPTPGALASALQLGVDGRDVAPLHPAWQSALSGLGTEAGRVLERLWSVQTPPAQVLAALRAIYLWWGMARSAEVPSTLRQSLLDSPVLDWSSDELRQLERLLLARYYTLTDLRHLAGAADLDPGRIAFSGSPQEVLRAVLTEARNRGRLRDLVQVVLDDPSAASMHPELRALLQADPGSVTATLRLHQSPSAGGRHQVEVQLEGAGAPVQGTVEFGFSVLAADAEAVRWYLEDSLEVPPDPVLTTGVERRLADLGTGLFTAVFGTDPVGHQAWTAIRNRLATVRVEVSASVPAAQLLPWELLRDPASDTPVAVQVASFVRGSAEGAPPTRPPDRGADRLRVLLVTGPPGAGNGAFRSVARYLTGLGDLARTVFQLDVLRPPTFARLTAALEAACAADRPYHVVHYDGSGAYVEHEARGYLAFHESPRVDGRAVGTLLARTGVPVLLLNACRSWYAEAPDRPRDAAAGDADVDAEARAYGSVATEAVDAGLPGAVALPYRLSTVTAAQFTVDLYRALQAGQPLGAAVTAGRRQMAAQPERSVAYAPRPLQDWLVPVVWEPTPLSVVPAGPEAPALTVEADRVLQADDGLPSRPDTGFYGRDETLLALDRAFDEHRIVVLHAYAGEGKSSTAAEFARWYTASGGLDHSEWGWPGAVLWSSFAQYLSADRLIDTAGDHFASLLEANGRPWPAVMQPAQRWDLVMQVLAQVPVLWIWDGAETVAGFSSGGESPWSEPERQALADFLRDLTATKARVLLTSRRDEYGWLGDLPASVPMPPLPMRERIQLAQALAEPNRRAVGDDVDWRPLLGYTGGNPLTINLLVRQALHEGSTAPTAMAALVDRLRAGEDVLGADEAQGRFQSLDASLSYCLAIAFSAEERARLSTLYLFQETVDADVLVLLGNTDYPDQVPELAGLDRTAAIALLDRAADIGVLIALGGGYYRIHPSLAWYLRGLRDTTNPEATRRAEAAYYTAIATVAAHYAREYLERGAPVIEALRVEEANLLQARTLAWRAGRFAAVIGCMQGLSVLYRQGRRAGWQRLVDELVPALVDPTTGGPRAHHDDEWAQLTRYRIDIAMDGGDWATAGELQRTLLADLSARAADALDVAPDRLTDADRRRVRDVAAAESNFGLILRTGQRPECVDHFERAVALFARIGDNRAEGRVAADLGLAYMRVPAVRDLDGAERWYRRSLAVHGEQDRLGRARTVTQLGRVAYERYREGREAGASADALVRYLEQAEEAYQQALADLPADATADRGTAHGELGILYEDLGRLDDAVAHLQESIRHHENAGDRYGAGVSRYNMAVALQAANRTRDAVSYAQAALRDFEVLGVPAADDAEDTRQLIANLERRSSGSP